MKDEKAPSRKSLQIKEAKDELVELYNIPIHDVTKKISVSRFLQEYQRQGCNASRTCKKLGICLSTYDKMRKANPELFSSIRETLKEVENEFVVDKLMQKIAMGDTASIIFYLKARMGWKESQDISIDHGSMNLRDAIREIKESLNNADTGD